jgi:D-sedoheptulose 7-phosphate isomerase
LENQVPQVLRGMEKAEDFFSGYGRHLSKILDGMDYKSLEQATELVLDRTRQGSSIFLVGNGGSAATASHFATDLIQCSRPDKGIRFRAISLVDNVPLLTALGNDFSYEDIFTVQMKNLFARNDVLMAISGSGNSPNILAAARLARDMGGTVIGLIGFDGGKLAALCDYAVVVRTNKDEYGPVEDIHVVIDHMVTSYLRLKLSKA